MKIDLVLNEEAGTAKGFDQAVKIRYNSENAKPIKEIWVTYCKNDNEIRKAAENKNVDVILGLEEVESKDSLHNRNSGMNEVICKLAKKNNIAIGFSFRKILHANNKAVLLGRMMQNVELCQKYKVKMIISSFAESKWDTRSYNELFAFGINLGMTPKEAKDALEAADNILKEKKEEKLPTGIKLVK